MTEGRLAMNFKRIDVTELCAMMAERVVQVVDIRDDEAFSRGHIECARHLHNGNIQAFLQEADPGEPLLVYCYHGHMSLSACAFFADQGFEDAYSLDGGYAAWSQTAD